MELALFNKNNIKSVYKTVDNILEKNGYDAQLGFIPAEKKRDAILIALKDFNRRDHFSICKLDEIMELACIKMNRDRYDYLNVFHCVDWKDIGEDTRAYINALIFKELESKLNV